MFNQQARQLGLVAIAVCGITLAACSKEEEKKKTYRSKEYQLDDKATGGTASGKVILQELTDSTFRIIVRLNKSVKDTTYTFALFKGKKNATQLDTAFALGTVKSQTTSAPVEARIVVKKIKTTGTDSTKFNYDSMLAYESFARITYIDKTNPAAPTEKLLSIGNVGKSAQ